MAKISPGDFKVITLKNSLLSQQAVTNKGIPVPYTNLQLNPYLNTQLDLLEQTFLKACATCVLFDGL